jgi:hypothetical protein
MFKIPLISKLFGPRKPKVSPDVNDALEYLHALQVSLFIAERIVRSLGEYYTIKVAIDKYNPRKIYIACTNAEWLKVLNTLTILPEVQVGTYLKDVTVDVNVIADKSGCPPITFFFASK